MTPEELAAIRRRCDAATRGSWGTFPAGAYRGVHISYDNSEDIDICKPVYVAADADFIAHARTDIPALLAEIAILRQALTNMSRETLDQRGDPDQIMAEFIEVAIEEVREALCTSDTPPA